MICSWVSLSVPPFQVTSLPTGGVAGWLGWQDWPSGLAGAGSAAGACSGD
ncbi:hypothetical protein GO283_05159 [Ralstonia solanacearum]|nr:hypothetical protein [Ralstonia solanacearum]NJZ81043.1 hypothetical protein [Ralstonia solanacearum]NKA37117.1 hypothetical protein [Ralstonia solanacearum]NKA61103.1 hypothetical protein [Ralstonia solanacearum]NKA73212.1 hypothetical protein [Ralstonia solanacearum]